MDLAEGGSHNPESHQIGAMGVPLVPIWIIGKSSPQIPALRNTASSIRLWTCGESGIKYKTPSPPAHGKFILTPGHQARGKQQLHTIGT